MAKQKESKRQAIIRKAIHRKLQRHRNTNATKSRDELRRGKRNPMMKEEIVMCCNHDKRNISVFICDTDLPLQMPNTLIM
jgi:hypothetical protein